MKLNERKDAKMNAAPKHVVQYLTMAMHKRQKRVPIQYTKQTATHRPRVSRKREAISSSTTWLSSADVVEKPDRVVQNALWSEVVVEKSV